MEDEESIDDDVEDDDDDDFSDGDDSPYDSSCVLSSKLVPMRQKNKRKVIATLYLQFLVFIL